MPNSVNSAVGQSDEILFSKRNCQRWNALRGEWGAGEVVGDRGGGGVAASAL